jgi:hypothetical protein
MEPGPHWDALDEDISVEGLLMGIGDQTQGPRWRLESGRVHSATRPGFPGSRNSIRAWNL